MTRIDLTNAGIAFNYGSDGINSIPRAAENSADTGRVTGEAAEQPIKEAQRASIAPIERGNQDPREAAQLIKPFNSSIPNFTSNDTVHTSDMAKAISDMQKDDMLREYQYFVGSANGTGAGISDVAYQDEDGLVRRIS